MINLIMNITNIIILLLNNIENNMSIDKDVEKDLQLLKNMERSEDPNNIELLDYQKPHADKLIKILEKNGTALDASDPGIGKTYIASYICQQMNLQPIVICPKNVVNRWIDILEKFDVDYKMVVNYELISRGKYVYKKAKIVSPLISIKKEKKVSYEWNVDSKVIFIFDEVHRCKFLDTYNARLLVAAKNTGNKILMLSATIVEKPLEFALFGYILNFSVSLKIMIDWIKKLSSPAKTIFTLLYSKDSPKAARLTIEELGDKFPDTQITAETYTMSKSSKIKEEYEKIAQKIEQYKKEGENSKFMIAKLQNEFRNIELLKLPTFIEMANDYIEDGNSVVIFVNYTDSLKMLGEKLNTKSLIYGGQSATERDQVIQDFQDDKSRIVIANIKAGGVGISLHDINGKYPRVSLISPTTSATNLIQALGRIHRSGGKTKSLQRIIFAADTPEDNISKMLYRKLANISLLNDGELETFYIDGLIKDKTFDENNLNLSLKHDLKIIIDEQLEKIKHKNFIKTDKISNLFPKIIDTISGADKVFLLKGRGILRDVEILLLGEYHNLYDPCSRCDKNCLEVLDLVTYITYSLSPNMTDFYIENPYNILSKKDKFAFNVSFPNESRINKLHDIYKHLLENKYPITENLRMHAVDIRHTMSTTENPDNLIADFNELYNLTFSVLGYSLDRIMPYIKMKNEKVTIDYRNNKELFDINKKEIEYIYDFLSDKYDSYDNIKKILSGDDDIMSKFKILKQKTKLSDNYDNNDEINTFIKQLDKYFNKKFYNNTDEIFDYLMYFFKFLKSINHINDTQEYMEEYLHGLYSDKNLFDIKGGPHPSKKLFDVICVYMDMYTIYRMLRIFDGKQQKNIIFYGGSFHTIDIYEALLETEMFKVIVKRKQASSSDKHDCQYLTEY